MLQATRYLEEAKAETVRADLEAQGYTVERDVPTPDGTVHFDLVATRGQERLVFELKARPLLGEAAADIRQRRDRAQQLGYTAFRLIVVNPPQERVIDIAGFADRLLAYLQAHPLAALATRATQVTITHVGDIELDAIQVTPQGIAVEGSGIVDVALIVARADGQDAQSQDAAFPLRFALTLNSALDITHASMLDLDTAEFAG